MKAEEYKTKISGMICPECEDEAASALLHTRGVISAEVSYRRAEARASYDPALTSPAGIDRALDAAGYPAGGNGRSGRIADAVGIFSAAVLVFLIPRLTALVHVPQAESGAAYSALFLIGLFTGVHCIGMCGGIMLTQSGGGDRHGAAASAALYNAGRVISYTVMGAVFGALGNVISYDSAFKSMLFTLSGAAVVLVGLRMWGVPFLRRLRAQLSPPCALPSGVKRRVFGRPLAVGLATGLMPCGALSAMWLLSAFAGSAAKGMLSMLVFALGTVPAMLAFGSLGALIPKRYNKYMLKASTVLIVALGIVLMMKGIRLM